ncbi:hypothetical protein PRIPAC_75438 [Pristionchus pacificus]|uniref:Uncharacterized protein n=1 Tax=Pristionchus pacificus TaxID=54126 RepID=A0A2A6C613_PRIPA|nr:hypothetical protein PRIPAC_75438 [Pristionchus pacificus]|eukprot:PDM73556.1 hypothetical protein PRIPAC_40912 [Pristionchus pacificus]
MPAAVMYHRPYRHHPGRQQWHLITVNSADGEYPATAAGAAAVAAHDVRETREYGEMRETAGIER